MEILANGSFLAILGAALSVILACSGSAIGVGRVGEAASGVIAEDSSKFSQTIILQALPGTQGIYGLLISFLIINKIGLIGGGAMDVSVTSGLIYLCAGAIMGFSGLLSAIAQGKVAVAGINAIARKPSELVKCVVYCVMVETYAVLSLLMAFLIYNGVK